MPESNVRHPAGELEVTATFTNNSMVTAEEFAAAIESALESIASDLAGTIKVLPNHDDTGVILGNG